MIYGEIQEIKVQKENDWGIYRVKTDQNAISVVGIIPEASIGMMVTLEGKEETGKYGKQFVISSVLNTEAGVNAGALKFFTDGYVKSIGPAIGKAIVDTFGSNCLDLFDTEEGRARLLSISRVTENTLEKCLPSYEENKKYKPIVLFLNGMGTKNQVESIYLKYGEKAVDVLKKNPYRLQMDVDGFGFTKTDKLAMASGIRPDSIYRIMAAVKYVLDTASMAGGHCFLYKEDIRTDIDTLLIPAPKVAHVMKPGIVENILSSWTEKKAHYVSKYVMSEEEIKAVEDTIFHRKQISDTFDEAMRRAIADGDLIDDGGKIYTPKMFDTECAVAESIAKMLKQPPVRTVTEDTIQAAIKNVEERKTSELKATGKDFSFEATEEQKEAVYTALKNRISIISGGPGRGKTAIGEIVAEAFLRSGRYYSKDDILMLAPTGRAAQRMTESTGYAAMTAHRAVQALRTGDTPKGKLILCDEASMVDIHLAKQVLKFAEGSNLVFVGDVNQIASVGPGKVLKDMIDSGMVPCKLLIKGHRNAGSIAENSEKILAGKHIKSYDYDEHFIYTPVSTENILDTMVRDYLEKIKQYGVKEVMLCTAMRERGAVSVTKLNDTLQAIVTKGNSEAVYGKRRFRVGDRVMQTKNDYQFELKKDGKIRAGVFNGEKGTVVKILDDPEESSFKRMVILFDDGSLGGYTKHSVDNLVLAYATTLHKCQGSEAACMMMAYTYGDYMLLNRSLFYTGETRAKKEFRFYGEEKLQNGRVSSAFDLAVRKIDDAKRNTRLKERIKDAYDGTIMLDLPAQSKEKKEDDIVQNSATEEISDAGSCSGWDEDLPFPEAGLGSDGASGTGGSSGVSSDLAEAEGMSSGEFEQMALDLSAM